MGFTLRELLGDKAPVIRLECPSGKTTYRTKDEAFTALEQMAHRNTVYENRSRRQREMAPYRCGFCEYFHLGHRR
jgi:hypothetical protein